MKRNHSCKAMLLFYAVLPFLFLFCQNPSSPVTENFTYPLTGGNSWQYTRSYFATNYRVAVNDSVFVPKDTQFSLGSSTEFVSVEREDSVTLPFRTIVMRDSSVPVGDTTVLVGRGWYRNSSAGLLKYAIDYPGGPIANPKRAAVGSGGRPPLLLAGIPSLLIQDFAPHLVKLLAGATIFISADTPDVCYRYPYQTGASWNFKTGVSDSLRVVKQYLQTETVTTPAGTFECFKIKWFNYTGSPGVLDSTWEQYEWVSPQYGLVKKMLTVRDLVQSEFDITTSTIKIIAKFDAVDEYVLTNVIVK